MMRALNIAMLLAILVAIYFSAMGSRRQGQLVEQGAEAHAVLCDDKRDLEQKIADSEEFLSLTPEERSAKYGEALGSIPPSVIHNSLRNQRLSLVAKKRHLDCS